MQNQLNQEQRFFCIAVKKPVISDPPEPFGQNMLHDQMQKVLAFEGAISCLAGLAFSIFKRDPAVLIGNDIFLTDHAPV